MGLSLVGQTRVGSHLWFLFPSFLMIERYPNECEDKEFTLNLIENLAELLKSRQPKCTCGWGVILPKLRGMDHGQP